MIIAFLLVVGVAWGSFVNALVARLYHNATTKKPTKKLSITTGRSMCMHCQRTLAIKDLLPIMSWLVLRGRCRYCKAPIPDNPLAEITVPLLFALSFLLWPYTFEAPFVVLAFGLWLVGIVLLVALLIYDMRWMLLPDVLTRSLALTAVLFVLVRALDSSNAMIVVASALGGAMVVAGLFYLLYRVSGGRWIGGGDVKLGVGIGLFAGSPLVGFLLVFIASLLGTLYALPSLLRGKAEMTSRLPFGPFLIVATIIVVLLSSQLIDWYINLLVIS